jgi:small GTP-binding protein
MPTNLPPEYFEAEKRFREAKTNEEKISNLEALLSTIPKHKGTDKLRADLRRRLAKLKTSGQDGKKTGKHDSVFHIDKEGAARVVIVGAPNVGKSCLVTSLTHARPKVSEYPFTTWIPIPGMMQVKNIQVQLIDTPPLSREHIETEFLDLVRSSDLILLMVDIQADPFKQLEESIAILHDHNISLSCDQNLKDDPKYLPFIVVANKTDDQKLDEDFHVFCELLDRECKLISLSAKTGRNLQQLQELVYKELGIIRIYSKRPGKEADLTAPFVLKRNSTLSEFAAKVHKDFFINLKTARVWGTGVYDGQLVGRDHILQDGDVVELHI